MMLSKKVVSILMVVVMLMTVIVVSGSVSAKNTEIEATSVNTASDYNLSPSVKDGNILHAFNWSMNDLVKYAPEIAAAGYSTVQISPIQNTKATANDGSYATDWWSFYQPTDMKIGNALGTEEELAAACTELHKYGVKIIADVVTNHVQNCESKTDASNIAQIIRNSQWIRRGTTATNLVGTNDNSREGQTQNDMGKQLPDLNTGNKDYQNYVINNLLIPLLNAGVDGFRFDAAKHIETPDDATGSDYWPTVTNAIRSKKSDAYIYGEILASAGKFNISSYTKYINVTDYLYGNNVRSALNSKNASGIVDYGYSGSQKGQNVLWVESHDTFCDQASTSLTKKQQILGWAAIGARADAPALFFVRPKHEALDSKGFIKYDELMGAPGAADTWKDPTVVAVNLFKNAFVGQSESVSASGSNLFVQRGKAGMVIVNLNGSSTSINQSCSMENGSYKDQITGNTFQVSGGKITGNVGSTGVAVIYNKTASNTAPTISLALNGTTLTPEVLSRYTAATATIKVSIGNATSGTIKVSNLDAVSVKNGDTTFTLNSGIAYGKSVDITVTATNGSKTVSRTYNIKKKNPNETKKVYFDNSKMKWPEVYVFCKTGIDPSTKIANYDAYKLTGSTTGIMSYTVPSNTKYVKFNEGYIGSQYTDKSHTDAYGRCHLFHSFNECQGYCGRTMPETVVNYGTANNQANRENGGYELVGAMIMTGLRFEDYGDYPVATLKASDTSLTPSVTPTEPTPTEPAPTQPTPTEPAPTEPVTPGTKLIRGDSDRDGSVTILDATRIQRVLAALEDPFDADGKRCADADKDGEVTILDATAIQRMLASIANPYGIGDVISGSDPIVEPTTAPEPTTPYVDPTTAPITVGPLPNKFVAMIYCEAFSTDPASRTKSADFNTSTGTLTYDFPGDSYVFVRNYDTGVQYCTDGWSYFANPVTLVNEHNLSDIANFDKMYVPAGTHTLYLSVNSSSDTCTLGYYEGGDPVVVNPTTPVVNPTTGPVTGDSDLLFIPGAASVYDPAWFAWAWSTGPDGVWIKGVESGDNIVFPGAATYSSILVVRMPTGSATADWNTMWNQSEDITVQAGKTLAFKSWGSGNKFLIEWR